MRKLLVAILLLSVPALAQNLTSVSATNIQKGGALLSSGQICFTGTDSSDNPIGFRVGGGGQEVISPYCATVTNGAIVGTFNVANPANTSPANINYRVEIFDAYSRVLKYSGVQFTGTAFNFDNYVPSANLPLGSSANNLSVGNLTVTGSCSGCAIGSGYNLIQQAGSNLAQRLTLNFVSGISCVDNSVSGRTDCTVLGGGVTSVAATVPSWLTVNGSPITASGTLAIAAAGGQTGNQVLASPDGVAGAFVPRALVANDIPALAESKITSLATDLAAKLTAASNLSDLASAATARTNLGLGTAATSAATAFSGTGPCGTNLFVSALNGNAAPGCTQPAYSGITGTPTLQYQTVQVAGAAQTQRPKLNFTSGVSCSDNPGAGSTDCSITAAHICDATLGDGLNAIPAGTYPQTICGNQFGGTATITSIRGFSDNNGTTTATVANGAGTSFLTGAITCTNSKNPLGAAGTPSATTTLASGDSLSFSIVADGTSKQVTVEVTVTR